MEDKPVLQAPRVVLKNLIATAAKRKLLIKTGVEAEFFLNRVEGKPTTGKLQTAGTAPCRANDRFGAKRTHGRAFGNKMPIAGMTADQMFVSSSCVSWIHSKQPSLKVAQLYCGAVGHGRTNSMPRDFTAMIQMLPATGMACRSAVHSFAAARHELKQLAPQQRA